MIQEKIGVHTLGVIEGNEDLGYLHAGARQVAKEHSQLMVSNQPQQIYIQGSGRPTGKTPFFTAASAIAAVDVSHIDSRRLYA